LSTTIVALVLSLNLLPANILYLGGQPDRLNAEKATGSGEVSDIIDAREG
jgi:hypothetical protein